MNLSDLCPEGLDLYAEFEKYKALMVAPRGHEQTALIDMPQVFRSKIGTAWTKRGPAYQSYQEHVRDCELCKEE